MYNYFYEKNMNPFLTDAYYTPDYFCDRENETKTLLKHIENRHHTAFFAQRRIGKTALIQHVFYYLQQKKTTCIYIDIYATQNIKEFTNQLANSIYSLFSPEKSIGKRFIEAIKLLRPVIIVDDMSGKPQLSLDITQSKQFEKTIPQLLQFLDSQNKRVVIAIDEFQQILNYPEKNVEALLRTVIQTLKNTCFIFCGSNQSMMRELFNSAKRPFYGSTRNINLQKIDASIYASFIKKHFSNHKFKIAESNIELILELSDCHTYYTQRLCSELFATNIKYITTEHIYQTLKKTIKENDTVYFQFRNLLTSSQWQLLKAIAIEKRVEQPFAHSFVSKHQLGTPASVRRSLTSLLEKEMIYYHIESEHPYYEVYDKFLMLWMSFK